MNTGTSMTSDRMIGSTMGGGVTMPSMMNMPMMPGMAGMMMPGMPGGMTAGGLGGTMVPRCTMKMEKVADGMKCTMMCDDKTAAEMMKNLCMMMPSSMCSMACMCNGMCCCCHNMGTMGMCRIDMMDMGCTMTCTSGDKTCAMMIQACCDCMMACMSAPGCCCCMMLNGMPVCCSMAM